VIERHGPARILVVDDDPALLTSLARMLTSEGFAVDVATDGAEGLTRARARRPTLVLLDLRMPVLDGAAFLAAFRALPAGAAVPVILITGSQDTAAARRRIDPRGVVLLLPKPFELDTLLAAVRGSVRSSPPRGSEGGAGEARATPTGTPAMGMADRTAAGPRRTD
jgi:DNA-binding response OmpR family regulator